ncbi:MAG: hypothetical protein WAL91_05885 [Propionicimonas sp.]
MLPVPASLPLETLPGWPAVYEPSVLDMLALTLFIPLAMAAVVAVMVLGPGWKRES